MRLAMKLGISSFVIAAAFVAFFLAAPRAEASARVSGDWDKNRSSSCCDYNYDYDWDRNYRSSYNYRCDYDYDHKYDRCNCRGNNYCKPSYKIVNTAKTIYVPEYEVVKHYVPKTVCVPKVKVSYDNYRPSWNNCYSCR